MMRNEIVGALLGALLLGSALGQSEPPIFEVAEIDKIKAAEGKLIKVRGTVESTGKSKGSGMNFLNFPGGEFTAVVFGKSLKDFPEGEPADLFEGKLIEVSGKVSFYNEKPQIVLDTPEQLVELDPATKKPIAIEEPEPEKAPSEPEEVVEPKVEEKKPEAPDPGKVDPREYFDDP